MLSNSTIDRINREIVKELRHYDSIFCNSQADKLATLERISQLKSVLDPSPTAEQIASALVNAMSPVEPPKPERVVTTINLTPLVAAIMDLRRINQH